MDSRPTWHHKPSLQEHEAAEKARRDAGYVSMSAFVREAVLRLTYADDPKPLMTSLRNATEKVQEVIRELQGDVVHTESEVLP